MTDPKEQQETREPDDLDLDAETVRDLEPSESDAEDVRGGRPAPCASLQCPPVS